MDESTLLDEQLAYYRQRAAEYDEWWERKGRYDRGEEANAQWHREIAEVRAMFDALPLQGEVVELAPGTGYWTELLATRASLVTAVDGSTEMIALNKARLGDLAAKVNYQQADLFEWQPSRRWDGLVACFWISHVPRDRLGNFFRTCREALNDGATLFFLDGQRTNESSAVDQSLPEEDREVMVRKLNDGQEFRIVKNFYDDGELITIARSAGFDLKVHRTHTYFQYGVGTTR